MKKRIISAFLILLIALSIFCACKKEDAETTTDSVIPSKISDEDSYTIGNDFQHINEQEAAAASTKGVATTDEFNKLVNDPDRVSVGYYGAQDIDLNYDDYVEKVLTIKTVGAVTVNSPVSSVIVEEANNIDINAKADSLIVNAKDVSVNVNADTGSIFVKGTNVTVNVYSGYAQKILLNNSTATVVNNTEQDITVTLTNGTKVTVSSYHTYFVKTDELKQNAVA